MDATPARPSAAGPSATHALMQLTLATEELSASRGPDGAKKRLSKRATAKMVDSLPSPVSSASSKDYASAKRRGFSAPSLKRSVTAVSRMTDRLASIPSLSRSSSSEVQATATGTGASAGTGAPTLQRAKTESSGASSGRTIAMVSVESTKTAAPSAATRTTMFGSLTRSEKAKSAGERGALPNYEPETRLCPLDSPVNAVPLSRTKSSHEAPSKPSEPEPKSKRRFAPGIPSLVRTSSKDSASPPPKPAVHAPELPPPVSIAISPPIHESKGGSPSPNDEASKDTPKRSKRKFGMPSLRRSSTGSSDKSVSSFVVPTSEATASSSLAVGSSSEESTMESPLEVDDDAHGTDEEKDRGSTKAQKFGIPSLLRSLTGTNNSKRRVSEEKKKGNHQPSDGALPSPTAASSPTTAATISTTTAAAPTHPPSPSAPSASARPRKSMLPPVPSSTKAAARFFSGIKPKIRRSVPAAKGNSDKAGSGKEKMPSTEDDFSDTNADDDDEDEEEREKEMRSLLHILQVPRGRRGSTLPLMSTGQEEISI